MFNNPLIKRYRLSEMRPSQVVIYATIYTVILLLMGLITYSIFDNCAEISKSLYFQVLCIQSILFFVWCPYSSSVAIRDEILGHSYDFFKMLPLTAGQKTAGILIGQNLFIFTLATVNFILMFGLGINAKIELMFQIQVACVLLSVSMFLSASGLLSSIDTRVVKGWTGTLPLVILVMFMLPIFINGIIVLYNSQQEVYRIYFLKFKISVLWLVTAMSLYFAVWSIMGSLRKFTHERAPLFTVTGAFLFMAGYEVFILSIFYYSLTVERFSGDIYAFGIVSFLPLLAIPFASRKTYENYIEYLGREDTHLKNINLKIDMFLNSNILVFVLLYLIWAGVMLIALLLTKSMNTYNILTMLTYFSSYLFLMFMLELFNVLSPSIKKIGILLGFVLGLYVFLPLILAGVFDHELLIKYSPVGLLAMLIENEAVNIGFLIGFIVYNLGITLIPALFIVGSYFRIVQIREQMK